MATPDLLLQAGVVFVVLALGGGLAARFGRSVIRAYLIAGVLVGPNVPTLFGVDFVLVARGEFSLVIAVLATRPDVALGQGETIAALAVGYVLVMGLLGTVLMRYSGAIERRVTRVGPGPVVE